MADDRNMMHIMAFSIFAAMSHTVGSWRHPLNNKSGFAWEQPELWQHLARECERGKFDAFFFADQLAPYGVYEGSTDPALINATQFPVNDPLLVIPMMAAVTKHLGFASTLSATYHPPYMAVRKFSTLDHLTRGRTAWNVVTSYHANEAANFGVELLPHDERYLRADEFMEVCHKLWNSWEPDAVVADVERGIYADPSKVHQINHHGKYFDCAGFSPTIPSPQHHPVIFQAGASKTGRDFCAKWAEAAFVILLNGTQMKAYVDDMNERLASHGREPGDLQYFFGIQPIVGVSESEALEKQHEINELVSLEGSLAVLSGHTGFDFSKVDLDATADELPDLPGVQGIWAAVTSLADHGHEKLTIREGARLYGQSILQPQIVGTAEQVTEQLITLWEESGGHGFLCTSTYTPGSFTDFVDLVIPQLQKYKVFRHDYTASTLRGHLKQTELGGAAGSGTRRARPMRVAAV